MSDEWVQKQLQLFRFDFDEADKDNNGSLSFLEVFTILKARGFKGNEKDAMAIFKFLDYNRTRSITADEFSEAMMALPKMSVREFALRKIFKALDKDRSGYLSKDEITEAMEKPVADIEIPTQIFNDMMAAISKDKKGQLDYENFLRLYRIETEAEIMRHVFSKLDVDGNGFLTRQEVYEAAKSDFELKLSIDKISDLIMHMAKRGDDKISYDEFLHVWLKDKDQG